ncbi:MAG: hypothetical protein AAF357_04295 [Verrucomicrobiota bacterium]
MKCPECPHNQRRGQEGMKCKRCGYAFVFDPKKTGDHFGGKPLTDGKFLAIIAKATESNARPVTENQLYTHAGVQVTRWSIGGAIATIFSIAIGSIVIGTLINFFVQFIRQDTSWMIWPYLVVSVGFLLIIKSVGTPKRERWDKLLSTWERSKSPISMLLREPGLHQPPPEWPEEDIYDYGFERILIVERDILVDWLIGNGFHLAHNALIIAESGYPDYLLQHAARILAERPDLPVYLLHDATSEGVEMEKRILKSPAGDFLRDHPIIDLGLNPESIDRLGLPRFLKKTSSDLPVDALRVDRLGNILTVAFASQASLAEAAEQAQGSGEVVVDFG